MEDIFSEDDFVGVSGNVTERGCFAFRANQILKKRLKTVYAPEELIESIITKCNYSQDLTLTKTAHDKFAIHYYAEKLEVEEPEKCKLDHYTVTAVTPLMEKCPECGESLAL